MAGLTFNGFWHMGNHSMQVSTSSDGGGHFSCLMLFGEWRLYALGQCQVGCAGPAVCAGKPRLCKVDPQSLSQLQQALNARAFLHVHV